MALVLRPPAPLPEPFPKTTVFLAGSIEMGLAPPWQKEMAAALSDLDVLILDPRRDEWDSSWRQDISEPYFREQVEWELAAQERADVIAMYFAKETKAPITLLELGLFAKSGRLLVSCPEGYFRRGNVQVVCNRYGIWLCDTFPDLVNKLRVSLLSLLTFLNDKPKE